MYLCMDQVDRLYQLIDRFDKIIIHRHQRPDPDAFGSQLGLKELITAKFPEKLVLAAGSNAKGLAWLGCMDTVTASDYEGALVIVTDTANTDRIDGKQYVLGDRLVKIDHHPQVDSYGDLQLVYPEASSTSEIIELLTYAWQDKMPMTQPAAALLYAGIVGDTGRFMFDSTTSITFEAAARLARQGIDLFSINDHFQVMTPAQAQFQAFAMEQLQIEPSGLAWLKIDIADRERYQISEEETNNVVNLASQIEGVYVWVTLVQQQLDGVNYRARIRSKGPAIHEIASHYHGGGHPKASGASLYQQADLDSLLQDLRQAAETYQKQHIDQ